MKAAIHDFIENGGDFNAVALRLYAWQRANNPAYDQFCGSADPQRWQDIPAVPVALFRDISFVCLYGALLGFLKILHTS